MLLDTIHSRQDLLDIPEDQLGTLCGEIRQFLVQNVSRTGGHLASNLGIVETTVAIHRVFDTSRDRLVFDVGHQCYVHKMLTGRMERFDTLRQRGGLSGFPKPCESVHDAFIAGHASNAVSVALGMARARTMAGEDYHVLALMGDGALTGGLAYEGLANVGGSSEPIVIILNDNGMSINGNVGGMAKLLSKERVKPGYINFKRWYRQAVSGMDGIYNASHKLKEALKKSILPSNMFDSMGIYYLGPVDGHDVDQLETVIRWAKEMNTPVLVHVISKKGKGCAYAEEHPDQYHGVGKFDPATGQMPEAKPCFSSVFGNKLTQLAEINHNIVAITAAMCAGTGLTEFSERFPDRFFDVGIAEEHAVSMAAGMAKQGLVPVVAIYSGFLQRAYDMLIHDVSLQDLHVVFCVDRAGLVGNDGETHHGAFDISYLRSVPHMQVLCPANFAELEAMLDKAVNRMSGPVAIRYPRGGEGRYTDCHTEGCTHLRSGNDITIAAYGTDINIALNTADILSDKGIYADVYKLSRLDSGYYADVIDSMRKTGRFLMSEQVCQTGCIADEILACAERAAVKIDCAYTPNLGSGIVVQGTVPELIRHCGLDEISLAKAAEKLVRGE